MTSEEKNNLIEMLPSFTKYLNDNQGKSLISRVYGVYQVKYPRMDSIYLILQRNNIPVSPNNELYCKFDLKGSKFQR
jgi:hypothetical protein